MSRPITFADFQPGARMGEHIETYDPRLAGTWQRIFGRTPQEGADGPAEAASIAVVLAMRAYLAVVTPRPPGNVQARQRFMLHTSPRPGEAVRTVISCAGKEIKRGGFHVELQAQATGHGGRALFSGRMNLIWAA